MAVEADGDNTSTQFDKEGVENVHFFKDGVRRVDFVLAYHASDEDKKKKMFFESYLESLRSEGLHVEKAEGRWKGLK